MLRFAENKTVEQVLRYMVGLTFIYASIHKIAVPDEFAKTIYGYGLAPHILINLMAIVIPFLELFTGLALVLGIYPRAAGILIGAMLLLFIVAISINLIRGHEFDCGCFSFSGKSSRFSNQLELMRDVVLFLCCMYPIRFNGERRWSLMKI